jgi:predicted nucleic acid-binding protein
VRAALDSNIIIYAEDMFVDRRRDLALKLIADVPAGRLVVPMQAAGEALNWLIRKGKVPKALATLRVQGWLDKFEVQQTTPEVFAGACELVSHHDFQVWDAVILSAAAHSEAEILLSEDMQDGFRWRGVTVVNPFLDTPSPLIQNLLKA